MPQSHTGPESQSGRKEHWSFKYIAVIGSLLCMVLFDMGLRLAGIVPPDDPLVFHARTHMSGFTPFVELENDVLTIRPDWVKRDETYRFTKGTRAGRLFLHPGFRPVRFSRIKPTGTLRIFVLGGSTTFGQWVGPEKAFPHLLSRQLQPHFKEHRVEVINLGCPGLESTRVGILFKRVLTLDPDLVVVYSGHNEMLMGPGTTLPAGSRMNTVRAQLLRISTLAAWLNHGLTVHFKTRELEIVSEEIAALESGKMLPYVQDIESRRHKLLPAAYLEKTAGNYAANMRSMILAAQKTGVPAVFILPATNLLYPPEQSAHAAAFKEEPAFNALMTRSVAALHKGELDVALGLVDQAVNLSPGYAQAWHLRGTILLRTEQPFTALQAFQKAVDLNVYAHRLTSPLETAFIQTVGQYGARWVDLRPAFYKNVSFAASEALFVDHCHPTEKGHQLIAAYVLPELMGAISP